MKPPKGLALTGSILAIVVASLLLIGGVLLMIESRRDEGIIIGLVGILFGIPGIVLGAIGCSIKAGPILANAIIFSVMSVLGMIGLGMGRPHPIMIVSLLLYITTTVFLYLGFVQASKYRKALSGQS
jgi:hypothetical protein